MHYLFLTKEFFALTKPRVVSLIVFTALVGMLLAVPGLPPLGNALLGFVGIWLAAASAAALNHLIDRRADAEMARTRNRPLPTGHLTEIQALVFALALGALSMLILAGFVNVLTAVLTFFSLMGYAVIYTVYLKRATPQNIVIGGAAGAAPPVLGWTAVTGSLSAEPLLLFLIIFAWTPPHFWALAIARRDDYAKVDIPMLPVTHGIAFTGLQIIFYTILLVLITLLPYLIGMSGLIYLAGTLVLDTIFMVYALRLYASINSASPNRYLPMRTFSYSIIYLFGLFAFLLIDHYLMFRLS